MKKFIYLLTIMLSFSLLVGCNLDSPNDKEEEKTEEKEEVNQLATPKVSIDEDGLATWKKVKNADEYAYKINGGKVKYTDECKVQLELGDSIEVKAVSDSKEYSDSDFSKAVTYNLDSFNPEFEECYEVLPEGKSFENITSSLTLNYPNEVTAVYEETNGLGYVFKATTQGFSNPVNVIVGVGKDGKIAGIIVEIGQSDFPVSEETINSYIGQDSNLNDVVMTSGATVSSKAVKTAVENGFKVLVSNDLLKAPVKTTEQVYNELLPTVYSRFTEGSLLMPEGKFNYLCVGKNSGLVAHVYHNNELLLAICNNSLVVSVYEAVLIDGASQTYELNNVTIANSEVVSLVKTYAEQYLTDYLYYVTEKLTSKFGTLEEIEELELKTYGSLVEAYYFNFEGNTYYAYYARPINGFEDEIMDVFVILDSYGKIVDIDVKQYFYGATEYFMIADSFNSKSYENGLIGVDEQFYDGSQSLIVGATCTSNAMHQAIEDIFTEFENRK